jgi:hypothetical protein
LLPAMQRAGSCHTLSQGLPLAGRRLPGGIELVGEAGVEFLR